MASKNFQFRLSAEGWDSFARDLKAVEQGSMSAENAIRKMAAASPQLATSLDQAQQKTTQVAERMRAVAPAAQAASASSASFGQLLGRGGAVGIGITFAEAAFEKLRQAYSAVADGIPEAGDAFKLATARLENVAGNANMAADAYQRLMGIARQSGSNVGDTVGSFTRFSVAAKDIGATTEQVLKLVEGLQKFAVVSGVSGQEAAATTQQLAQALASGKFQGDELRSVMENMPQLAQALAQALGVGVGQLRQMGSDGKLTAEVIFPALLRAVEGIDEKFQKMPSNVQRSWNGVEIAFNNLLAQVDRFYDVSGSAARQWDRIAAVMDSVQRRFFPTQIQAAEDTLAAANARVARVDKQIADEAAASAYGESGVSPAFKQAREIALQEAREAREVLENIRQARREDRRADLSDARSNALEAAKRRAAAAAADTKGGAKSDAMSWEQVEADIEQKRQKQIKSYEDLRNAIDPTAAALARYTEQMEKLDAAETDWAQSEGAKGIDPAEAANLRAQAFENYSKAMDGIADKADGAGRAFDQFFSRAASGFEDAITKGKSFGDVMKGLEQDIARLLLRATVLDPLSEGVSGFLKGQGGAGGLLKSGFDWIKSFFADGGIMTSAGPVPLHRYAGGGIASSPQLAMFGEGSTPEAYVPLPDGRRIPVAMQGGGAMHYAPTINVSVANSNASPQQIAATVELAVRRSKAEFVAEINRGGGLAKTVGRRR